MPYNLLPPRRMLTTNVVEIHIQALGDLCLPVRILTWNSSAMLQAHPGFTVQSWYDCEYERARNNLHVTSRLELSVARRRYRGAGPGQHGAGRAIQIRQPRSGDGGAPEQRLCAVRHRSGRCGSGDEIRAKAARDAKKYREIAPAAFPSSLLDMTLSEA